MRKTHVATALVAIAATSVLTAPQAVASTTFANQEIKWQKCTDLPDVGLPTDRLECGSFTAPMDWHNPNNGKTITIAVSRLTPLKGKAKSTVFTNPGGPGGPGRVFPAIYQTRPKLSENADIIGIDVRGTGASSNVTCGMFDALGNTDPRDRSKANLDLLYGGMDLQAKFCQTKSGELGKYITTEQTVRDLDLLRQLLKQRKVSWLGYSGGSWMGAHYATYFPKTLDKIVLDSNTEFTASWQTVFSAFGPGAELRFRTDFLPWVAKYDNLFHLGKTAEEVRQSYERTRKQLAEQPVQLPEGLYIAQTLDLVLFQAQYSKYNFEPAAQKFAQLAGTATRMSTKASYPDAQTGTLFNILCNDTPFHGGRKFLERDAERIGSQYPLIGWYQVAGPCAFWDRPNVNLKRPTGHGIESALMVQSVRDPATPLAGAQRAHAKFRNSVMLTVENEGDHGVYGFDNECANTIVERYLVDGITPTKDLTCQGVGLPEPGAQQNTTLAKARQLVQLG